MELDDLKHAWHTLGQRLERQESLQFQLLKERKLDRVRRQLRPLFWGQCLQILLGIGLVLLGIACWSNNAGTMPLFAIGICVHVYGVLHIVMAGATLGRIHRIDYAGPVLAIQKQMARLLAFYLLNANLVGLSWWVMWLPVFLALPGIAGIDLSRQAPSFIWISLAVSALGLLGTWLFFRWRKRRDASSGAATGEVRLDDGGDGIRRGQRDLDELARFERD